MCDVPLASTFVLSSKAGRQAYVQPVVKGDLYSFTVKIGPPPLEAEEGTKAKGRGANFRCLLSGAPISGDYIKSEGQAGRIGTRLMAIVTEGPHGRLYIGPTEQMLAAAESAKPTWRPSGEVPARLTGGTCVPYGLKQWGDLFTPRQLVALTTLSDLVENAREKIYSDAIAAGMPDDAKGLEPGGKGATAYAEAIATLLGLAVSRSTNSMNSLVVWSQSREQSVNLFSRQAIPMAWDFPEVSPFSGAAGGFGVTTASMARSIENVSAHRLAAFVSQADAQTQTISAGKMVSTDPPYYDNISVR